MNTAEPRNFRKNDPTKVNNIDKPREKIGQSSNNSMGPQCFGCQGYGHMKSECPTYLKFKGKAMAVTLSNCEVFDDESECDEDGNFIAFTATVVVMKAYLLKRTFLMGNSLWMQIFKRPTINFAKLLQSCCKGCYEC